MGIKMGILNTLLYPAKRVAEQVFTDGVLAKKEVAERRFRICKLCPYYFKATGNCKKCGCFVDIKTKYKDQKCKLGKW
jgi:hypothetical protein